MIFTKKKKHFLIECVLLVVIPSIFFLVIVIKNKNEFNKTSSVQLEKNNIVIDENDLINKALQLIQAKKYQESIELNLKVISINPNNSIALNNIGYAYGNLGQWTKGIEYCSRALKIDPNFHLAKNNLNWMKSKK